jgi:hypothetical protein
VKKTDFQKLKVGQRVTVTGEYDGYTFDQEIGTVVPTEFISPLIRFDTWSHGHGAGQREWHFGEEGVRTFNITVIPEWSVAIKPVKPLPRSARTASRNTKATASTSGKPSRAPRCA